MSSTLNRRAVLGSIAAIAVAPNALAQDRYPDKGPVKLIVPLPAGGAADATVRMLTTVLQEQMKQTMVIDNKPGGNFAIGMQTIARAAPDGYTLMHVNSGMASTQAALKKIDLLKTLTPISLIAAMPVLLVVPAKAPYKTVKDLVAWGKANPGKLNYGSVGIGSMEHLWASSFTMAQGVKAVHIPFKGMPEAAVALASEEVQMLPLIYSVAQPLIQKGMLRPLAIINTQRATGMPDVPTIKEAGFDAPAMRFWGGLAAPAETPAAIVEQIRRAIVAATNDVPYREKMAAIGATPLASETSQSFAKLIAEDLQWMDAAVKAANLELN